MAEFEPAFTALLKWEGGYSNNPADRGGETYRGISRKNWPGWDGWPQVDKLIALIPAPHTEITAALGRNPDLQGRVRDFYRRNFWMPPMQSIADQSLANWLFDKAVNLGIRHAYKLMQRALHVDEDGVIGLQTLAAINSAEPTELLAACRDNAKRYYTSIALHDPSQSCFLHGWLARA